MSEHSIFKPSSFHRLVACPGSWSLESKFPDTENVYSQNGKQAHELASNMLKMEFEEASLYNIELEKDVWHGLMGYVNHINDITKSTAYSEISNNNFLIETKIELKNLHSECFGTADAVWQDKKTNQVHIWDLKYGYTKVDAIENWQMLGYSSGFLKSTNEETIFNLHIIQPKVYYDYTKNETWRLSSSLLSQYEIILINKIEIAQSKNPPFSAGKHCQYCKARSICKEFAKHCSKIINSIEEK